MMKLASGRNSMFLISAALSSIASAPQVSAQPTTYSTQSQCSRFIGTVQSRWIGDRKMRLLQSFSFVDPTCLRWDVPAGTEVDGASIPRMFWAVIGGPFEGAYREASVIHDYYCVTKSRDWRKVHRMFYDGMLASGTDPVKAKIMYYAVLVGGPRWKTVTYSNHAPRMFPEPGDIDEEKIVSYGGTVDQQRANADINRIQSEHLSVEQIEALAEQDFNGRVPPDTVRTDL